MKTILPVYFYAYDHSVKSDGTVQEEGIHCSTYEPKIDDKVILGKTTASFDMPDTETIKLSKLASMEFALEEYRRESLAHIESLQGRINELKALPQDVA